MVCWGWMVIRRVSDCEFKEYRIKTAKINCGKTWEGSYTCSSPQTDW